MQAYDVNRLSLIQPRSQGPVERRKREDPGNDVEPNFDLWLSRVGYHVNGYMQKKIDKMATPLDLAGACYGQNSLRSKCFRGVWEQRKTEERDFRCFTRVKNGARAKKNERGGLGRGRKETLVDKPLDFENFRSPANGVRDWLG